MIEGAMAVEARLTRLEECQYFQEQLLRELHEALRSQQEQLDAIERRAGILAEEVGMLRELLSEAPVNVRPPHALPEKL